MLVLAPAACCLAGVAVHEVLKILMQSIRQDDSELATSTADSKRSSPPPSKKGKPAAKVPSISVLFRADTVQCPVELLKYVSLKEVMLEAHNMHAFLSIRRVKPFSVP